MSTTSTSTTTQRIVVVHGPLGRHLADVLRCAGLETIVDDGTTTIWGPQGSPRSEGSSEGGIMTTGSLPKLLVTTSEAAAILGVSRSTLYSLLAEGQLESVKIGSLRRISTAALDRYVGELPNVGRD